jgi:ubiquinone/menaquinone biosynthesis C-methylase UbiE
MEFEQQYVHGVYTDIAEHFDKTRTALWGSVHKFIQELPKYSRVLDCGCGNGKYLCSRNDLQWSGMDCCTSLLEVAHKKSGKDVLQANALNIPFRSNVFNAVLSIAVIHHLSNQERRLQMVQEILRILQVGGRAIITAWALEQECPKKTVDKWTCIKNTDYMVPWQMRIGKIVGPTYQRYYHLFVKDELEQLVKKCPNCCVLNTYYEEGNWGIVIEKTYSG